MARKKILIGILVGVLIATILIINLDKQELTGKTVGGSCSGTNNYYLCIDGSVGEDGDFVLGGVAVPLSEIIEIIDDYRCKLVSLEANETFIFRHTSNTARGIIYDSGEEVIGEKVKEHITANYECYLTANCNLTCSEYRVWE